MLIVPSIVGGGQERIALNTYEVLKDIYDVRIIIFDRGCYDSIKHDVFFIDSLPHDSVGHKIVEQIRRIYKISKIRRSFRPDYVYSFGEPANLSNVLSGVFSYGKSIVSIHGYCGIWMKGYEKLIFSFVYKCSFKVIVVSEMMKKHFIKAFPRIRDVQVIYNGYQIDKIRTDAREKIELQENYDCIAVGRLDKEKRFHVLIEAFQKVCQTNRKLKLAILGSGEEEKILRDKITCCGLENNVFLIGYSDNPYRYIKNAKALLVCSKTESFSNVIIEALAVGTPVISVDCPEGPREILAPEKMNCRIKGVYEGKYGILIEDVPDELLPDSIAKAILKYIGSTVLESYSKISYERAEEFGVNIYKKNMEQLFE